MGGRSGRTRPTKPVTRWESLGKEKNLVRVLWGDTGRTSYQRAREIPQVIRAMQQINRDGIDLRALVDVAQPYVRDLNRRLSQLRRQRWQSRANVLEAVRELQRRTDPFTASYLQPSIDLLRQPESGWPPKTGTPRSTSRLKDPYSPEAIQRSEEMRALERAVFAKARQQLLRKHQYPGLDDPEFGKLRGLDSKAARYTFVILDSLRPSRLPLVDPPPTRGELLSLITPSLPKSHRLYLPVERIRSRVREHWTPPVAAAED